MSVQYQGVGWPPHPERGHERRGAVARCSDYRQPNGTSASAGSRAHDTHASQASALSICGPVTPSAYQHAGTTAPVPHIQCGGHQTGRDRGSPCRHPIPARSDEYALPTVPHSVRRRSDRAWSSPRRRSFSRISGSRCSSSTPPLPPAVIPAPSLSLTHLRLDAPRPPLPYPLQSSPRRRSLSRISGSMLLVHPSLTPALTLPLAPAPLLTRACTPSAP